MGIEPRFKRAHSTTSSANQRSLQSTVPAGATASLTSTEAAQVFYHNEVVPLQTRFQELNEWIGEAVIGFQPYELAMAAG